MPIYLDYNATAPIRPEVIEAMAQAMQEPANPSSVHGYGRAAKKIVEDTRAVVAEAVGCFPHEVVFVSSGTEANNLALRSFPDRSVIISAIEHSSIMKTAPHAVQVPVSEEGVVGLEALERMMDSPPLEGGQVHEVRRGGYQKLSSTPPDSLRSSAPPQGGGCSPPLVSLMLANNETGVLQPIGEAAALVHEHGGILHCDAVQAFGKIPVDMGLLKADLLTISAHKFGGPQGIAALIVRQDIPIISQLTGGGQEKNRRAGTENVAAIAGFAKAIELARKDSWQKPIRAALDKMEEKMLAAIPGAQILGQGAARLPNTSAVRMPGVPAETQLINFDLEGFAISAGSACSSGRIEPSHVGLAMGLGQGAGEVIRISAGWNTKVEEIEKFTEAWVKLAKRLITSSLREA